MNEKEAAPALPSVDPATEKVLPPGGLYYGEYDEKGVDLSLLRYTLSLSPLQRLILMERHARDTKTLQEYGRRNRQTTSRPDR